MQLANKRNLMSRNMKSIAIYSQREGTKQRSECVWNMSVCQWTLPPAGVLPNCTSLDSEELLQCFRQNHSWTDPPARDRLTELKCKNNYSLLLLSRRNQKVWEGCSQKRCFVSGHLNTSVIFVSSVFSYSFHVASVDKEEVRPRHWNPQEVLLSHS